jgi:hypothetical protein
VPRPENPITWGGPIADLAQALRRLRARAGNPSYRTLAERVHYSATTLADAAAGRDRPTWQVTESFAQACRASGAGLAELRLLWARADKAAQAKALAARRTQLTGDAALSALWAERPKAKGRGAGEPRPPAGGSPAQFVRQLRALRAWAGQPGHKEITNRSGARLAASTMYDALDPARSSLPSLEVTKAIVSACAPNSLGNWIAAWRAIRLLEFDRDNPIR